MKKDLEIIDRYQKEIILLGQASALLGWDQQTYMPKKGVHARAEQSAILSSVIHEKFLSDEFFNAVKNLNKEKLDIKTKFLVQKLFKELSKARNIPKEFVEELSKAQALSFHAWQEARDKNKFSIFQPHLEKITDLRRKQADYLNYFLNFDNRYDALLDGFEEGMTSEKLKPLFDELKVGLIKLLKNIKESKVYKSHKEVLLKKDFPKDIQIEFAKDVFKRIGLSEDISRIDLAEHPFETRIGVNDIRITTNVRNDPLFAFGSTIHEAGHALYEFSLSESGTYNFLRDAPSTGLHESQSRFWELSIGMQKPFWEFYFPKFNDKFNLQGTLNDWYKEINHVKPSLIRIESDEVHYCLHIIIRFEIETELLEGKIQVKDLPKIWNEKRKKYIGIVPKTDKEGVMQDVHWSEGYFGYFPTYAIGTMYAAQIYYAIKKDIPSMDNEIKKGDYSIIRKWLHEKIHKYGAEMYANEIIEKATGEGLNPKKFIEYLNKKYQELYQF